MSQAAIDIYAQSLFEVAQDHDVVDAVGEDLQVVETLMSQEPGLLVYLTSPCFTQSQKTGFVIRVFGTEIGSLTRRFFSILLEHGTSEYLPGIIGAYQQRWDQVRGIKSVQVTVAQALDEKRNATLKKEISTILNTTVRLDVNVDPTLLGGVVIRCDDQLIDNSLRGRLARATQTLNDKIRNTQLRVQR